MADAIVSAVLQQLVTMIYEEAKEEVRLVLGVDKEMETLKSNFQVIQAVLQDAERRQVTEACVRDWLNKLQDLSHDVEDVLDEWNTALLKFKIKAQARKSRNKVCTNFLPSSCFCVKQVALRHDIGNKIKELDEKLRFINRQKQDFSFVIHEKVAIDGERPKTTSIIDLKEVRGREKDKISIKSMLLPPSSSSSSSSPEEKVPLVVSIVGMGGIGKTTLAQLVYNDEEVTKHFDLKIWICVSDSFDETRIVKEIFEKCFRKCPKVEAMDMILEQISEYVSNKKVLLVLDDVWTDEIGKWDQLMYTLKCTASGSRILVTTRKQKAAMVLGSREVVDILHLGILKDKDSWLLFTQFAFHDRTSDEIKLLEGVGKKIMDKCEGLPLAIKIIGSHLRFKRTKQEWEHVLMSDTWKIKDAEKELFGPLLLSYYELPHAAKRCFIHCALFPKDYQFNKNGIMRLWMAQGFCGEGNDAYLKTKECFDDLAMRGFFQDFRTIRQKEFAKMHDIVHDFAMFLSGGEYYYLQVSSDLVSLTNEEFRGKSRRHMFLDVKNGKRLQFPFSIIHGCEKLRSMHIECRVNSSVDLSTLDWRQFKLLRTLKLQDFGFEVLPDWIGKLEHLRLLDLSGNNQLRVLSNEVCDLCNLETLDISYCQNLEKLPQRVGELINLKYLINSGYKENPNPMPKGIAKLVDIKEIHDFIVGSRENEANLADLGNLLNIEVVKIDGLGNIKDTSEGMKARLRDKTKLKKLELCFTTEVGGREVEKEKQEQLLEALSLPSSLEVLGIKDYCGRLHQLPSWLESLTNLKHLVLDCLSEWERLPPLGKLFPTLEELFIGSMPKVKKVGVEFLGISSSSSSSSGRTEQQQQQPVVVFPKLKTLLFWGMNDWEDWDWSEEELPMITIMPRLIDLQISVCDKLRAIPRQLLSNPGILKLDIRGCSTLRRRYGKGAGVDWHTLSHIPSIYIW